MLCCSDNTRPKRKVAVVGVKGPCNTRKPQHAEGSDDEDEDEDEGQGEDSEDETGGQ